MKKEIIAKMLDYTIFCNKELCKINLQLEQENKQLKEQLAEKDKDIRKQICDEIRDKGLTDQIYDIKGVFISYQTLKKIELAKEIVNNDKK